MKLICLISVMFVVFNEVKNETVDNIDGNFGMKVGTVKNPHNNEEDGTNITPENQKPQTPLLTRNQKRSHTNYHQIVPWNPSTAYHPEKHGYHYHPPLKYPNSPDYIRVDTKDCPDEVIIGPEYEITYELPVKQNYPVAPPKTTFPQHKIHYPAANPNNRKPEAPENSRVDQSEDSQSAEYDYYEYYLVDDVSSAENNDDDKSSNGENYYHPEPSHKNKYDENSNHDSSESEESPVIEWDPFGSHKKASNPKDDTPLGILKKPVPPTKVVSYPPPPPEYHSGYPKRVVNPTSSPRRWTPRHPWDPSIPHYHSRGTPKPVLVVVDGVPRYYRSENETSEISRQLYYGGRDLRVQQLPLKDSNVKGDKASLDSGAQQQNYRPDKSLVGGNAYKGRTDFVRTPENDQEKTPSSKQYFNSRAIASQRKVNLQQSGDHSHGPPVNDLPPRESNNFAHSRAYFDKNRAQDKNENSNSRANTNHREAGSPQNMRTERVVSHTNPNESQTPQISVPIREGRFLRRNGTKFPRRKFKPGQRVRKIRVRDRNNHERRLIVVKKAKKANSEGCDYPQGDARGSCQEYVMCSTLYINSTGKINLKEFQCELPKGRIGICCPNVEEHHEKTQGKSFQMYEGDENSMNSRLRHLIHSNLAKSISYGEKWVQDMEKIEKRLLHHDLQVKKNSPAFGHNKFFPSSKEICDTSHIGFHLLQASNDLSNKLHLPNGGVSLKSFKSPNSQHLSEICPVNPVCTIVKYRSIDGSCNNLRKPKMGQNLTPLSRVLPPAYADGRWEPRISVHGFQLPSPRLLSQSLLPDQNIPDNRFNLMVMQFGQFLDHDLSSVPVFTFGNSSGISCCQNGQLLPSHLTHPNCLPIEIPRNDPFYRQFGQRCMNFVRSRMGPRLDCSLGYADQMNALTHWIDGSNIYGSNEQTAKELRLFDQGLLKFSQLEDRRMLLPLKSRDPRDDIDYKAGDPRVNEMQGLMVLHLVWFREHNRLALALARINPFWNDEQLFQEARRILVAEYQHIVYNEWLPVVIGREYMNAYGILPLTRGYYHGYDSGVDGSVENSFSAAGFRMGHSMVQGIINLVNEFGVENEISIISQHDRNIKTARSPKQVDKWLRGLSQQPMQQFDPFVTEHLNGRLFQNHHPFGMDLSALNIQRGRDHGLPGYNSFRELCQTGIRARRFDDFKDWIPSQMVEKFKQLYAHPDDVDLWIGGLSERILPDSLMGPTFTCIVGDQFARSKKADRFFYDIANQPHSFTPGQLREIRKANFARILCDNGDNLEFMQPSAFLLPDFALNTPASCRSGSRIPKMDLSLWKDEPVPI